MKKYRVLLLLFATFLFMASCNKHDIAPTVQPTAVTAESEYKESVTDAPADPEITVPAATGLAALSDYDLYETVYLQTLDFIFSYPSESAALEDMTQAQRVFYILSIYDMEIQNGGLCQFFVNSSRSLAPHVENCLETVGADAHKDLFTSFIEENQIDVSDLDSFIIYDIEDYAKQTQRYDFDSFDMNYYDLPPLFDYLVKYIRNNIYEF